jgi:hypothetical protein
MSERIPAHFQIETCGLCGNPCSLTDNVFGGGKRIISVNGATVRVSGTRSEECEPYRYNSKGQGAPACRRRRGKIGIPLV